MKALDLAKWFLDANPALRDGYYDSCMKLNRLLFLTNLMHYALTDKELIDEKFERWDYGPVIRELYTAYRHNGPFKEAFVKIDLQDTLARQVIKIVNFWFSNTSTPQLSAECREFSAWKEASAHSEIRFENTLDTEKEYLKTIYDLYGNSNIDDYGIEMINGHRFTYDKQNLAMTDDLIRELEKSDESAFIELIDGELVFS